jgi:hypothetical protein
MAVSAEARRHWLHELGWEWERAKLTATGDERERGEELARLRVAFAQRRAGLALVFADALDIKVLPTGGYQGRPKGGQGAVLPPGTKEQRYLAGALGVTAGLSTPCVWYRTQTGLVLESLAMLARTHPAPLFTQLPAVVDNANLHNAKEVQHRVAAHPRFALRYLPP